jgi:alpha-mannosidase
VANDQAQWSTWPDHSAQLINAPQATFALLSHCALWGSFTVVPQHMAFPTIHHLPSVFSNVRHILLSEDFLVYS